MFFSLHKIRLHKRISPHGDFDDMGEAINLVNNFKVDKVIFNCEELAYNSFWITKEQANRRLEKYCILEIMCYTIYSR